MSERKVLNKYYPPDFDPSKIPKLKLPRNRQYSIRIMAPFNMRCNMCGEYIYKGKKFNSRKETVEDEDYLGLKIFRFYIKCPRCVSEIAFKTDLRTTDYALEDGATRNFEASKTAEEMAIREKKAKEDEELNNPMKVLENRTKASRMEMEQIDALEELKEMNSRLANVDHESMLKMHNTYSEHLLKLQEEEDEKFVMSVFGQKGEAVVKRLQDSDSEDEVDQPPLKKTAGVLSSGKPTDLLTEDNPISAVTDIQSVSKTSQKASKKPAVWEKSIGMLSSKSSLAGLVRKKTSTASGTRLDCLSSNGSSVSFSKSATTTNPSSDVNNTVTVSHEKFGNNDGKPTGSVNNLNGSVATGAKTGSAGLGLLADYSDSEEDSNS